MTVASTTYVADQEIGLSCTLRGGGEDVRALGTFLGGEPHSGDFPLSDPVHPLAETCTVTATDNVTHETFDLGSFGIDAPPALALSGAAVLVVALMPATLSPVAEVPAQEDPTREAWATDVHMDPVPAKAPLPVKNQKRAPCTDPSFIRRRLS